MPSIWIASRSRSSSLVSIHAFMRAPDNATKRREVADFDSPAPSGAGTSPSGNRTERLKRRVETLISIGFIAHLPSQSSLTAFSQLGSARAAPSSPRTRGRSISVDLALAAVKADLAFGPPPAVRLAPFTPLVALATGRCRILLQQLAQRLEPGGKAKAFKARRHARQRLGLQRIRGNRGRRGMLLHGVAFLPWNQHPEPKGSRRATPLLPFQHSSGHRRESCWSPSGNM